MHAGSAGIRHRCGHAPCWNTIGMRALPGVRDDGNARIPRWNTIGMRAKTSDGTRCWRTATKCVENSWERWKIRKTGGQKTSRFDTSVLEALCFARVIFWKVRHYESISLFVQAEILGEPRKMHLKPSLKYLLFYTCSVLEYSSLQFAPNSKVRKFTRKLPGASFRINVFSR